MDTQKRALRLSATQHIDLCTTWIQSQLDDEQVFPTRSGQEFPVDFVTTIRTMFRHLFRIFAHLYHAHYQQVLHLEQERHLNTLFAHFICFGREFDLLDKKETGCLQELTDRLLDENSIKQASVVIGTATDLPQTSISS